MSLDPLLQLAAALGLGLMFIAAGADKLRHPRHFREVVTAYQLIPRPAVPTFVLALGTLELLAGVAVIQPFYSPLRMLGATMLAFLLLSYAGAIGINLARGRRNIDCGCFGARAHERNLSGWLVVRSLALFGVAALMHLPVSDRSLVLLDYVGAAALLVTMWCIHRTVLLLAPLPLRSSKSRI